MPNNAFWPADILIPTGIDLSRWSVVACDQFSSEPDYWARVGRRRRKQSVDTPADRAGGLSGPGGHGTECRNDLRPYDGLSEERAVS